MPVDNFDASARRPKCSDIPDEPILILMASGEQFGHWDISRHSVLSAMPPDLPEKLPLAKMRQLLRRGLVEGCGCGCRGDWTLTRKGFDAVGVPVPPGSMAEMVITSRSAP